MPLLSVILRVFHLPFFLSFFLYVLSLCVTEALFFLILIALPFSVIFLIVSLSVIFILPVFFIVAPDLMLKVVLLSCVTVDAAVDVG